MIERSIIFLHGFASSGQGTKAQFLREKLRDDPDVAFHAIDFNPTPADFETMTVTGMINRLRQYVLNHEIGDWLLIGSSMGALPGLHYAHRFGGVPRLLLLAPALRYRAVGRTGEDVARWRERGVGPVYHFAFRRALPLRYGLHEDGQRYLEPPPPAGATRIIHGRADDVLPIRESRAYAAAHQDQVHLIEVDATHDLNGHLDLIWEQTQTFLLNRDGE